MQAHTTSLPWIDEKKELLMSALDVAFVVTNPALPDNPIQFASPSFCSLTGYSLPEVLNRNCRFLQGPLTERQKVMEIRDALREERPSEVCLLNYKKSGETFWNQLFVETISVVNGLPSYCIGLLVDVTSIVEHAASVKMPVEQGIIDAATKVDREKLLSIQKALSNGLCGGPVASYSQIPASLMTSLANIEQSFVLVDAQQEDMPIVHMGDAFLVMTGYARNEIMGRNCRFLQGPGTDMDEVHRIQTAIRGNPPQPVTVTLLNYRRNGTPFWNSLFISPIRGSCGKVVYFVGVQLDVSQEVTLKEIGLSSASVSRRKLSIAQRLAHSSAVGKVKIAVRALAGGERGLRRDIQYSDLHHKIVEDLS